jgi:hyperosmotically inducible periplasmic protein
MRTIIRALFVLVLIAVVGVMLLNYWPSGWSLERARANAGSPNVGTTGNINTERARERAADIGEKAAVATKKIQENLSEAALTTKIKAKMALDDTLRARAIDVSTEGSTVTVSGTVPTVAAHTRAIALARETAGVSVVVDHLEVVAAR